jgi:hypothetical protein
MKRLVTFSMLCLFVLACLATQRAEAQFSTFTVQATRAVVGSVAKNQIYYNPTGENYVSGGARVVARGMRVYYYAQKVDTTSVQMSTYAWSITSAPTGSTATISTPTALNMYFNPDVVGKYIVSLTVNGTATDADTIVVSTYVGHSVDAPGCFCHQQNQTDWAGTRHAKIFTDGVTGLLEPSATYGGKGAYGLSCIKCHTTGWESKTDNGNFGYIAQQTKFDSLWWKGLTYGDGDYWITPNDKSILNMPSFSPLKATANIGCESCHGPANEHRNSDDKKGTIAKSLDAGQCNQCHNAVIAGATTGKHNLGAYWLASKHSTMPTFNQTIKGSHAPSAGCARCHSGTGFFNWTNDHKYAGSTSDYAVGASSLSCPVCHDAHSDANPNQIRTVKIDSLVNGYKPTAGGKGLLCMNCHQERTNVNTKITTKAPYYGWGDRFGAHHSPQADVLFGQDGYEYGKTLSVSTHGFIVQDACVTCHMPTLTVGSSIHSSHAMTMDSAGVNGCQSCHPGSKTIADIKTRFQDYDGNGKVEAFQVEVAGLMAKLKAKLPIDPATGNPINSMKDSLLVKNNPKLIQAIWNYYLILNDGSTGVHNPQYVIALLKESIGQVTGVESFDSKIPATFELSQNYPNPFNPSTEIRFSVPTTSQIRLQVYNSIGQLVATLADGTVVAGNYTAKFNASGLASGIYLYRLESSSNGKANIAVTKKMLLVK